MNFKDIIGPDELDWKVIPLDWKKIGKNELKLGTPVSKDGLEANDASCYGILMDDVEKSKHFQARVIVSGCVDLAKAEEYSGIKISEDAKNAIGKVWSQAGGGSGPIDPKRLPEGYPYKEQSETVIEWDGNTEGRATITGKNFKVTDIALSGLAGNQVILYNNGVLEEHIISGETVEGDLRYYSITLDEGAYAGESLTVLWSIPAENAYGLEGGTYFYWENENVYLSKVSAVTETIHPMAPEFLPAGVGGGAFIVNVTVADDGATCTADKTFAEMEEAYLSGKVLKVVENRTTEYTTDQLVYDLNQYMSSPQKVLSFVNILPGGVNFRFYNIMIMENMAQKMTFTMTGEFTA